MAGRGRPWQAVVGRGRPWQAVAGRGRPWQAVADGDEASDPKLGLAKVCRDVCRHTFLNLVCSGPNFAPASALPSGLERALGSDLECAQVCDFSSGPTHAPY